MKVRELKTIVNKLSPVIISAGEVLIREFESKNFTVRTKEDDSPVTEVDIRINKLLGEKIKTLYPDLGIISEENSYQGNSEQYGEYYFIIDPLDSTKNFIQGIPFFDISISLYHYNEPLLGLVLDPIHKSLYTGIKGGGAYLNGIPIKCRDTNDLGKLNVDLNIAKLPHDVFNNINQNIARKAYKIRYFGNAVLEICWISCGKLDVMINHDLSIWDLGACGLILEEAGGKWTTLSGSKPVVKSLTKFPIIAANSEDTHSMIIKLVDE